MIDAVMPSPRLSVGVRVRRLCAVVPSGKLPLQRDISQNCNAALGVCPDECSVETLSALISFLSTLSQIRGAATYVRSKRDRFPIPRREQCRHHLSRWG